MVVWLLVSVGLFLYISWFRIIYINFVVVSMVLLLFLGNRISSPAETLIVFLMTLTVGAVIGLMYSASLLECFVKDSKSDDKGEKDEDEEDELE